MMERVSHELTKQVYRKFIGGFLIFLFLVSFVVGIYWVLPLFILGLYMLIINELKVKDVYLEFENVIILSRGSYVKINLNEISDVYRSSLLKGCFRIDFKEPKIVGQFVLFTPRIDGFYSNNRKAEDFLDRWKKSNQRVQSETPPI